MVLMGIVLAYSSADLQMVVDRKIRPIKNLQIPQAAIKKNHRWILNRMVILLQLGMDLQEVAKLFLPDNSMPVEVRREMSKWWIRQVKFLRLMLQQVVADVS